MEKRVILFLFAACLILAACADASPPSADRMISIGSHRLQVRAEGIGTPTIVFDTGIADQMENLRPLQDRIAQVTRIVTYNRAGYGRSEPGPLPRDSGREADELRTLLEEMNEPGPFVLVGHSLGALNVQVFASRYPDDVAGMILLDPPPLSFILGEDYAELGVMAEGMTAEWQSIADAGAESADAQERTRSTFFRIIASEHREMFGKTARLVGEIQTFGDLPLVVVAAGRPNPAFGEVAEEYQRYWVEQSRSLVDKSAHGSFAFAEDSSHHLYTDVPELVESIIRSVVNDVRTKSDR